MKKMFTPLVIFLLFSYSGFSQIYWSFSDSSALPATNSYADITVSPMTSNENNGTVTALSTTSKSSVSDYATASGTFNIGAAARTGGFSDSSAYFEFTLTPTSTNSVILSTISFGSRSTSTGPLAFSIRTSLDGFTDNIAADTLSANSHYLFIQKEGLNVSTAASEALTVRIYGYNDTGRANKNTINWRLDDVTVNGSVLPVSLTAFSSSVVNNKVLLSWNTANEINLKGFSVEKSGDAKNFSELSYIASSHAGAYTAQDALQSGVTYYRLKMINLDGSFSYSKNVVVNTSGASSSALHVYPNPVISSAVVWHPQAGNGAMLKVTDLNGRVLQTYTLQPGAVQTTINAGKLLNGTYVLLFRDATGKVQSTRIIKN